MAVGIMRKALLLLILSLFVTVPSSAGRGGRSHKLRHRDESISRLDSLSTEQALMRYAGNIHQFNQIFPQEKVYIQFDNSSYYQGETIWFKAYVVEASTHGRSASKVLYVDLVSPAGDILKQEKLKIVAGQADGSFPLVDGSVAWARELRGTVLPYPSGFYEVRAYTANMLNFSQESVFSRVLPVFETPSKAGNYYGTRPVTSKQSMNEMEARAIRPKMNRKQSSTPTVTFYPEGGSLVSGLPGVVAFKVTGPDGFGLNADGALDDTVRLTTVHDGMGRMEIPSADLSGGRVTLRIGGRTYRYTLPRPLDSGCSMLTQVVDDTARVRIAATSDLSSDTLGLTMTCRGELFHFSTVVPRNRAEYYIPLSAVPEGVCQLTLFDRHGTIYARRSLFNIRPIPRPALTLESVSESLKPFGKVRLDFSLRDGSGNPFRDRFCLSVRDSRCPGTAVHDDLRTALLLSSDIRGFVENPEYYFEDDDSVHRASLDLLMLVQGWERYDWQTMSAVRPYHEEHRLEEGLTLNGWVVSPWRKDPMDSVLVIATMSSIGRKENIEIERFKYRTGPDGYFGFDLQDFTGSKRLVISAHPHRRRLIGTSAFIRFERSMTPDIRGFSTPDTTLILKYVHARTAFTKSDSLQPDESNLFPEIIGVNEGILLPEVDIREKRPYVDYNTFHALDAEADTRLELDRGDYTGDIGSYLSSKGYLYVTNENGDWVNDLPKGVTPFYYVHDSKGYWDNNMLGCPPFCIDMMDVKSVLVYDDIMTLREAWNLSPLYLSNTKARFTISDELMVADYQRVKLIEIVLKEDYQRPLRSEIMRLETRKTTVEGFSPSYSFYSPEYPDGPVRGDVDYRRTLYWNPNVITDAAGHASVEFYNNSYSTHFNVSGAGITASGTPYVLDAEF